jgi:hypothetical protein
MQATTTPKLAAPFPAAQAALAAVVLAVALTVVGTIGIALQRSAPATPNAGQLDGAGQRRQIVAASDAVVGADDRLLDGAAFRNPTSVLGADDFYSQVGFRRDGAAHPGTIPIVGGYMIWVGTQPGTTGKIADDQMSYFNGVGLSKPGADETEKVGRAHR